MSSVAVLGLGSMGSRMAANLIKAGHSVTVWNRSPQATAALASQGASVARTAKEAAGAADFVIAMLRDDEASRQVWLDPEDGALAGMRSSSIAIESSTLTPNWVRELARAMTESNVAFLEAPVSGARAQAEAGQLVYHVVRRGDAEPCTPRAPGACFGNQPRRPGRPWSLGEAVGECSAWHSDRSPC